MSNTEPATIANARFESQALNRPRNGGNSITLLSLRLARAVAHKVPTVHGLATGSPFVEFPISRNAVVRDFLLSQSFLWLFYSLRCIPAK